MKRTDNGMFHAARPRGFDFQVQTDLVLAAKRQDLFHGGDALTGERGSSLTGRAEPTTRIELAQFFQGFRGDRASAVGGSFERVVVQSHQAGITRELQVSLDKAGPQLNG